MKQVPSVDRDAPLTEPIRRLREHGVAVLTDDKGLPIGILTLADLADVSERAEKLTREEDRRAGSLYEQTGSDVVRAVKEDETMGEVAGKLAVWQYKSGVPVVDKEGVYRGYIFLKDLTKAVKMVAREREQQIGRKIGQIKASFPDQWQSIKRQLPFDFK
jgi:CBS domain-containing protein